MLLYNNLYVKIMLYRKELIPIEELIGILLIVSPGFIVRRVKDSIVAKEEVKTGIENTVISIIYSIPILFMNLIALMVIYKMKTISQIISKFDNLKFILCYGLLTIVTTLVFIYLLVIVLPKITNELLNKIRKRAGEPERTSSVNPWQDFFKVEGNMLLRIIKDNTVIAEGFLKHWDVD